MIEVAGPAALREHSLTFEEMGRVTGLARSKASPETSEPLVKTKEHDVGEQVSVSSFLPASGLMSFFVCVFPLCFVSVCPFLFVSVPHVLFICLSFLVFLLSVSFIFLSLVFSLFAPLVPSLIMSWICS